ERNLGVLELADDALQLLHRLLEAHLGDVILAHDAPSIRIFAWAATDAANASRSYPPSSVETSRPAQRRAARSTSFSVIQTKSASSSISSASGSRRWASKPAEMIRSSGACASSAGRSRSSQTFRNAPPPLRGASVAFRMLPAPISSS